MTPTRYERIRCVFLEARELALAERDAYLRSVAADDSDVCAEVGRLLIDETAATTFLAQPVLPNSALPGLVAGSRGTTAFGTAAPSLPERIGRYRIIRKIGEGGMGAVFEAEQDQPRRRVALKCVKAGVWSDAARRRFEVEAEALGRLHHSGIAQIFEAGTADTPAGPQPYFAMELIDGQPLNVFVAKRKSDLRARLRFVAAIADAVQHAHAKGVIHRDLKPGNILIAGGGEPKILDLGVARLMASDVESATRHTGVGELIGTLPYMAPEQLGGDPGDVDTRADVYALGVILFELLTGRHPRDLRDRSIPDALRTLRIEPARLLSSAPDWSGQRRREFRGDLETIVAKALEQEKDRRYPTAAALAADVRRYLHDEPIAARPATAAYQLTKFARRNKVLVGGAAGVMIALAAGLVATSVMYFRAEGESRRAGLAEQEQSRLATLAEQRRITAEESARQADLSAAAALQQSRRSRNAMAFIADVLVTGDPNQRDGGAQRTVVEAAELAARELDSGVWRADPDGEMVLRDVLGTVYEGRGHPELAEPQYRRALALAEAGAGPRDASAWSRVKLGAFLRIVGSYADAELLLEEAVSEYRQSADADLSRVARAVEELGNLRRMQGRYSEAEALLDEAIVLTETAPGDQRGLRFTCLSELGRLYQDVGRFREGEAIQRRLLEIGCEIYSAEHLQMVATLANLGTLISNQHRAAEAEPLLREALVGLRSVAGERHPTTVATLKSLATCLMQLNRPAEAEPLLREVIALRQADSERPHPLLYSDYFTLGTVYHSSGRVVEAESAYRTAIEVCRAALGPEHTGVGDCLHNLAVLLYTTGRAADAEPLAREALRLRTVAFGEPHFKPAQSRSILGGILVELHQFGEAELLLLSAFDALKDNPPVPKNFLPDCVRRLIALYENWNVTEPGRGYEAEAGRWSAKLATLSAEPEAER